MNSKLFIKFFLAIIALCSLVRLTQLGKIPGSLYWDEVAILVDAKSVAQTGLDMHGQSWTQLIFPSYGDYKLPVYIWLSAVSAFIFGATNWSVRLVSALAGIGTIVVAGQIAKLIFKSSDQYKTHLITLSTMAVTAFSPWSIVFSRTGFEGHLAQFFLSLSALSLLHAQEHLSSFFHHQRAKINFTLFLLTSIFLGTLATYTYFSVRFVWPIVFTSLWLLYWSKYLKIKHRPKWLKTTFISTVFLPLLLFALTLVPMTKSSLYTASNQFRLSTTSIFNGFNYALESNQLRQLAGNSLVDRVYFHRHVLLLKELAKNYADHLDLNYLFVIGDQNHRHGTTKHGLFLFASLPIFIYGLLKLWSLHKRVFLTIILWWMAALLPASVPESTPHALRSLNALVPISLIIGFGLSELVLLAKRKTYHHGWRVLVSIIFFANFVNFIYFANHYFYHYNAQSAYSWQGGYEELARVIAENKNDVSEVWINNLDGRFYLWLLAYDPDITPEKIQKTPKTKYDYQIEQIDNIKFAPFDWEKLQTNRFKTLVVGETTEMENKLLSATTKPVWFKNIKDQSGTSRFIIALFGE